MHNLGCKLEVFLTETNSTPALPLHNVGPPRPRDKEFLVENNIVWGEGGLWAKMEF